MVTTSFIMMGFKDPSVAIRVRDYSNGGFRLMALSYNEICYKLSKISASYEDSSKGYFQQLLFHLDGDEINSIAYIIYDMASKYFGLCVNFEHIAQQYLYGSMDEDDIRNYLVGNAEFFCIQGITRRKSA